MIYLGFSDYTSASFFINKLELKKDTGYKKIEVFRNEKYILIILGTGMVKSIINLTYILAKEEPFGDIFINLVKEENTYLINKISSENRDFYPDVIIKHNFKEKALNSDEISVIYQTSSNFFKQHENIFINYNENSSEEILDFIKSINFNEEIPPRDFTKEIQIISSNLKFSKSMELELKQLLEYFNLKSDKVDEILESYLGIVSENKKEGKIYLEEIKKRIIE